jgi:hypothetical protein
MTLSLGIRSASINQNTHFEDNSSWQQQPRMTETMKGIKGKMIIYNGCAGLKTLIGPIDARNNR